MPERSQPIPEKLSPFKELNPDLRKRAESILSSKSPLRGIEYLTSPLKRWLDIAATTISTPLAVPTLAALGTLVFLQDRHWPFVDAGGFHPVTGEHVSLWKVRTMIPNAQKLEAQITRGQALADAKLQVDDWRITKVGGILRRVSVDETPQLLSAAKGDLSIVGPRFPSLTEGKVLEDNRNAELVKEYLRLIGSGVKFGVTGLYLVMGRTKLSFSDRLHLDLIYGERATLAGDIKLIILTCTKFFSGK